MYSSSIDVVTVAYTFPFTKMSQRCHKVGKGGGNNTGILAAQWLCEKAPKA